MREANFYKSETDKSIRCHLCNHGCLIKNNQLGICGVRQNRDGKLYSMVYGYPIALNVDPVEKKPFFHLMPGTQTLSLGTLGCNFSCANCQNHHISQLKEISKKIDEIDYQSPERIVEEAIGNDCRSIAFTYTEPTVFTEYALDIMKLSHMNDLKNIWVSNGYMSEHCLDAVLPYMDAINIDLKSFDDDFYRHNCNARLQPILKNLVRIKQEQIHLEITTLVIPSLSDEIEMLGNLADFIATELDADTPWHFSRFLPEISWKLKNLPATGEDIIYQAYEIGKDAGLKYVYVGNIPGDQKENTYCPKCNELVIRRLGYYIERLDHNGRCPQCDRSLDIIE